MGGTSSAVQADSAVLHRCSNQMRAKQDGDTTRSIPAEPPVFSSTSPRRVRRNVLAQRSTFPQGSNESSRPSTQHLGDGSSYPGLRCRRVDACAIVPREAHRSAVARHGNDTLVRTPGEWIGADKRRRPGVAVADDAWKRPTGPLVVNDLPHGRKLDAAESVPFGHGRRHSAWTPPGRESKKP